MRNRVYDCIILGAGASGLVCAAAAAGRGLSVLLIDHAERPAVKMLLAGGGKCNLTNRRVSAADYVGENPDFCRSALARFTPRDFLEQLAKAGVALEEREHGQMFCKRSAKDLVQFFLSRCKEAGCEFALGEKILAAETIPAASGEAVSGTERFLVRTTTAVRSARSLIIALGGPAWPGCGATNLGHTLAARFGHEVVRPRPALAGLVLPEDSPFRTLAGVSLPASLTLERSGAVKAGSGKQRGRNRALLLPPHGLVADNLALLFTHRGISGPAALQASLYWRKGDAVKVGFDPLGSLDAEVSGQAGAAKQVSGVFARILPKRLAQILMPDELGAKRVADLTKEEREALLERVHGLVLRPVSTEGYARAEVTAGGVSTAKVSSRSMESALVPGLHFCGEVMDITGRLGGFNLHWAFASGYAAGLHLGE